MILGLLLLALVAWPGVGWGQVAEAPARLEPVVVTPARIGQQAGEAPASVTVIGAADIRHSANVTLDDLLRQVPSFSLFRRNFDLQLSRPIVKQAEAFLAFENILNETYAVARTTDGIVTIGSPRLVRGGVRVTS